jgi:transcriptional regulator with GAF, ATPase, and Fis domain
MLLRMLQEGEFERREDIALLVWYFIGQHQGRLGRHIDRIPVPATPRRSWVSNPVRCAGV